MKHTSWSRLYCWRIAVQLYAAAVDGSPFRCAEGDMDMNIGQANFGVTTRPPELRHANQRVLYYAFRP